MGFMRAHPAGPRHGDFSPGPSGPERVPGPGSLNDLEPGIWSLTAHREPRSGSVVIGGCDIRDLIAEFGSPLFVLDEADFRARAREFRVEFGVDQADGDRPNVYYAAKAFLSTTVASWAVSEGLGLDVSTGGELACARRAGVPGSHLIMHGSNRSIDETRAALAAAVDVVVIDSFEDVARVAYCANEAGRVQSVMIRVTVGVEAHTHEFIATAHEDQKFGFSIAAGDALEAARRVVDAPELHLVGFHSHIGSQIFVPDGFELAARRVVAFMGRVRDELGVTVSRLDLGGGIGIKYRPADQPLALPDFARRVRGWVAEDCEQHGLPIPELMFEPGRAVVGPAMLTAYTVGTVKPVELDGGEIRTYVSVDGGMSDNIRPALYDAEYTVALVSRVSIADPMLCRVVGKHCESGDIVVRDCWLPADLAVGDVIAVAGTGAYCRSMASNYNLVPRPGVVAVSEGRGRVVLRRETLDDVLALDAGLDEVSPVPGPGGKGLRGVGE